MPFSIHRFLLPFFVLINSFVFSQSFRITEIENLEEVSSVNEVAPFENNVSSFLSHSLDGTWLGDFGQPNGVRGAVFAMAKDSLGNIYLGGEFIWAENVLVNHIVKWDGHKWSALGGGVTGGYVYAIAVKGTDIYIAGSFTKAGNITANSIARWNGTSWSSLGSGMNGYVYALCITENGKLYVGGEFTQADTTIASNFAEWDGSKWKAFGTYPNNGVSSLVRVLVSRGDTVYIGGNFNRAGNVGVYGLVKFYQGEWFYVNSPVGDNVSAIAIDSTHVYVGGKNGGIGLVTGEGPVMIETGLPNNTYSIQSLAIAPDGDLYVCGFFVTFNGDTVNSVARWDGSQWHPMSNGGHTGLVGLGTVIANMGFALVIKENEVYVAGSFWDAGGTNAANIAKWNGSEWSALSSGLSNGLTGFVQAIGVTETDKVYVGGNFLQAGNVKVNNIACWNGTNWDSLKGGLNGNVMSIAVRNDTDIYVAGGFTMAGSVPATRLARWNGQKWQGISFNGTLSSVAVDKDGNVYVGGFFSMYSYGYYSFNVAKWNGTTFIALGTGLNSPVNALAVSDDGTLYAGTGTPSGGIQKWDGNSWQVLGGGANGIVYTVSTKGSNVYIGGYFSYAGTTPANGVAKWNGTSWDALGTGVFNGYSTPSQAMAISTDDYGNVYAGGWFNTAGGVLVNYIAQWNGSQWSSLNLGMDKEVAAVAVKNNLVYVGGSFTQAGNVPSTGFAIWDSGITPVKDSPDVPHNYALFPNYPNPFNPSTTIQYSLERESEVVLEIFDLFGRKIETVFHALQRNGIHKVEVNLSSYSSGIYICRLTVEEKSLTQKMLLIK